MQTAKAWLIDSLGLNGDSVEVFEKLPQGQLTCGSQEFVAALLLDPSIPVFPITEMQKVQSVWIGIRPAWDRLVLRMKSILRQQSKLVREEHFVQAL